MSSKVKNDGRKRRAEFKVARQKFNLTEKGFFSAAANEANIRNANRSEWVHLTKGRVEDDFNAFVHADNMGRFEAPRYVHEKIDRALGRTPLKPPRSAHKCRSKRQQMASGAAHATA